MTGPGETPTGWLDRFTAYLTHERRLSPRTVTAYRRDLSMLHEWCRSQAIGTWAALTQHHVRQYAAQRHRQGTSAKSLQRELSSIRTFYRFLMRENAAPANPALGVRGPKVRRRLPAVLDPDQISRLLRRCRDRNVTVLLATHDRVETIPRRA